MTDRYLMGVDIGTLGTKALIVSPDGRVLGSALAEYGVEHPKPSWAEQWPQVWEEAACAVIRGSLRAASIKPDDVAGVCVSGLYGGSGIPVDAGLNPLHPCLIWMDRRASSEVDWIRENVDLDRIFRTTGNYVDTYFGYPKILWIKRNLPDVWKRVHKFVPPSTYVALRLTGELAIDYSSAGNLGGLFDIHRLQWSEQMCDLLGIPRELMPDNVVPSTEVIGEITPSAAARCGLAAGTPVVAGGVDAPMATLSAGAREPGENVAMMGT
jgi:sugar (pentulose or hexulose) kinase